MLRTNIYLTKSEKTELQKLAKKTGLSSAELIRRAIDAYLKEQR